MTPVWAVSIPLAEAAPGRAAVLRLRPGIEVAAVGETLWLRGAAMDEDLERLLRQLPCSGRYRVGADGHLTPVGARVPVGKLPETTWVAIAAWFILRVQTPALAGEAREHAEIRVVRGGGPGGPEQAEANVLLVTLAAWREYAVRAPAVRLGVLRFAAAGDRSVLVHGSPLPPIAGRRYVEAGGVAVPAGYRLKPAVDPAVLRQVAQAGDGDLVLMGEDGRHELIAKEHWVPASRAAVRETARQAGGRSGENSGEAGHG